MWGATDPVYDGNTQIDGVLFVPGSRTVLFFGSVGTNTFGYGLPSTYNDPYRTYKGQHSLNGDYAYQVWAYNADDFLAVEDGQMQPWQLQPYATWNLDFPQFDGAKHLGGVAFDPSTNRLYVTELDGDTQAQYSELPLVQVFQLTLSTSGSPSGIEDAITAPAGADPQPVSTGLPAGTNGPTADITGTVTFGTFSSATIATANNTNTPQNAFLGTLPEFQGPAQPNKRNPISRSIFSRTDTLLRLSNSASTRIRDRVPSGTNGSLGEFSPDTDH